MFLDASVIVAILGREAGHEEIEKRLAVEGWGGEIKRQTIIGFIAPGS